MTGAYFDKYNLMVSVVRQLQAQVCDLSQQVGTAKGRRCKDVILEKRLKKMLVKELQSECLARGFSDSGTAPELRLRIGLELAGMSCKCRNAVASGVVAAVTVEANVLTTDADGVQAAIEAELRAEHAEYLAAVDKGAAEATTPAEGELAENEEAAPVEGQMRMVRWPDADEVQAARDAEIQKRNRDTKPSKPSLEYAERQRVYCLAAFCEGTAEEVW